MPIDLLVLGAAFLTGLLGTVHCGAMCGFMMARRLTRRLLLLHLNGYSAAQRSVGVNSAM